MTATFFGGAVGTMISGWLMARLGWQGIVAFGILLDLIAMAIHWVGSAPAKTREPGCLKARHSSVPKQTPKA